MKTRIVVASAMVMALFACSGSGLFGSSENEGKAKITCKPGQAYFCKCKDGSDGEHACLDDGKNFGACMQGDLECPEDETSVDEPPRQVSGTSPVSAELACPGKATPLAPGQEITLRGNTEGAKSAVKGERACGTADGPEHVYAVTPSASGKVRARLQGLFDTTLYVRSQTCDAGHQLACAEQTAQGKEELSFDVQANATYWLFADGKAAQSGAYSLTLALDPGARCNNGIVEAGEACDDGDADDNNGCNRECKPFGNGPTLNGCPGQRIHVWDAKVAVPVVSQSFGQSFEGAASCLPETRRDLSRLLPDRAFAVTAHKSGTLVVANDFVSETAMYVRTRCDDAASEIACKFQPSAQNALRVPVLSGQTYVVALDAVGQARERTVEFAIE